MDSKIKKHLNRKIRVLRLWAVSQAYHHYTMMQLHRKVLQHDNSWQDAVHLSDWVSAIMPYKESSSSDFLYDKNEISDAALHNYEEFKNWVKIAEKAGISEKALTAFCKGTDNMQFAFHLKALGHIFYPEWFAALFLYLNDAISKTKLQLVFVEYSLFTGKAKPPNLSGFRKTILDIETNISQITDKQVRRGV
jgi:hypothetical protein